MIGFAMFGASFNSVNLHLADYTVIFGALRYGSLQINSLELNNGFRCKNVFQSGVDVLTKIIKHFLCVCECVCSSNRTIRFCFHFSQHVVPNTYYN